MGGQEHGLQTPCWKECRHQMFEKKCPFQKGLFLIRSSYVSRRAENRYLCGGVAVDAYS